MKERLQSIDRDFEEDRPLRYMKADKNISLEQNHIPSRTGLTVR